MKSSKPHMESASKAPVASPPPDAIIIDEIKILAGRPIRGGLLFGCYFVPDSNDLYTFFDRDDQLLQDKIQSGVSFDFSLKAGPPVNWSMTATFAFVPKGDKIVASGNWSFGNPPGHNQHEDVDDGEDGTFHAQAGGGGMDGEKAAHAKAY